MTVGSNSEDKKIPRQWVKTKFIAKETRTPHGIETLGTVGEVEIFYQDPGTEAQIDLPEIPKGNRHDFPEGQRNNGQIIATHTQCREPR